MSTLIETQKGATLNQFFFCFLGGETSTQSLRTQESVLDCCPPTYNGGPPWVTTVNNDSDLGFCSRQELDTKTHLNIAFEHHRVFFGNYPCVQKTWITHCSYHEVCHFFLQMSCEWVQSSSQTLFWLVRLENHILWCVRCLLITESPKKPPSL